MIKTDIKPGKRVEKKYPYLATSNEDNKEKSAVVIFLDFERCYVIEGNKRHTEGSIEDVDEDDFTPCLPGSTFTFTQE